ncbi:unnamed protein product [Lupinus luteus]|uniref:Uncharacterized protein n=1 Tax=Lupinus luteus TaxID=3873 RepID=A0AAV1XQW3_LUPLU
MDNNYFGEANMGNERGSGSSSSSSSSRKGKKNIQDKPKPPQRGLGVAQLEKIRIHGQMATSYHLPQHGPFPSNYNNVRISTSLSFLSKTTLQTPYSSIPSSFSFSSSSTSYSASYGFQSNFVMGLSEYERTNIRYGDSHPTNTRREHAILETQSSAQPNTRHLLNLHDSHEHVDAKKHRSGGSSSQNSETSDTQEPDLELRLSL